MSTKTDKKYTQIEELKALLQIEKEVSTHLHTKIEKLNREVGQWQGVAKTYERQNEKLLTLEAPKQKKGFFARLFKKWK